MCWSSSGPRVGGRARGGPDAARAVADAVAASPRLRLRGVAGYEGSYPDDRVRGYLRELAALFAALADRFHEPIISAGGSRYFDAVAEELADVPATLIVRAGAFQAHDDVFYSGVSPFAGTDHAFRPALHARARVLSRPEPGLVLLDAGKRDLPSDLDLPVVLGPPRRDRHLARRSALLRHRARGQPARDRRCRHARDLAPVHGVPVVAAAARGRRDRVVGFVETTF